MKAIHLLVNSVLPSDVTRPEGPLTAKVLEKLLADVAAKHPDDFSAIAQKLGDIGRNASYTEGATIRLSDLRSPLDVAPIYKEMGTRIAALKKLNLDPEEFKKQRTAIWYETSDRIEKDLMTEGIAKGNNVAIAAGSGARGKPSHARALLAGPGLFADAQGNIIPLYAQESYSQGIRPAHYLAATFGARAGVISTKTATAKGGDWAKLAVQTAADQVVTMKDCGTANGIDLDIEDPSVNLRVLASGAGGLTAGTPLDKQAANVLRDKVRKGRVIVRSALTCQAPRGICAMCVGLQPGGGLPKIGTEVGITAANALGQPITQMALDHKRTAGMASSKKDYSGFGYINQFTSVPEDYPERATLAAHDGVVEEVRPAPQGGHYVKVNGKDHFVLPGFEVGVQVGQSLEAGDQISDGLIDPSQVVDLQGLGEGRRVFAERFKRILDDSGMKADPRNVELYTRGAMRHIRTVDPDEDSENLPDDLVDYSTFLRNYSPPANTAQKNPNNALGQYLQAPALHYTLGTRITPKVAARLAGANVDRVYVSSDKPWFKAEMPRLRTSAHVQTDWLASMHTSHLKDQLGSSAVRGADTNVRHNTHFAPRLMIGEGFGENVEGTGEF